MNDNSTYVILRKDGKWLGQQSRWVAGVRHARRFVGLDRAQMRASWCKQAEVVEVDEALKGERMNQPYRNHERKVSP